MGTEQLFAALQAPQSSALPTALRLSHVAYPLVNAAHIVGIALLFGGIVPLDLRLLGCWKSVPVAVLARVLVPMSIAGLVLAIGTGALLFSVGAVRYAGLAVFQLKMLLIAAAAINALLLTGRAGRPVTGVAAHSGGRRAQAAAALSIALWGGAILCGRAIAYFN